MKRNAWLAALTALILLFGTVGIARAEIIAPHGEGQIGLQAVVLCQELTMRQEPDPASRAVETLKYGDLPIVVEQSAGWARCVDGDSEDAVSGWINADYLAIDPAWYRTEEKTPVYAWNDTAASKVALLDKGVTLPILKNEGAWLIVSLRGAAGWIHRQDYEAESGAARQDGERFEDTVMLEGMAETVRCEHVVSQAAGVELDYDYENFERRSEADRECFISRYDDPDNPQNWLEVQYSAEDAEAVRASVSETLSKDYDIITEQYVLDRAGSCIRIDASEAKGGGGTPDLLQMVYIIPASDGCRVATAHYSVEGAEGFGARFAHIMNTLSVI